MKDTKNAYRDSSLDYTIVVLFIYPPLRSHRKALRICEVHLPGGVPLHFLHPAAPGMAVELFSVASNRVSQEKDVANMKYNGQVCFAEIKVWSLRGASLRRAAFGNP